MNGTAQSLLELAVGVTCPLLLLLPPSSSSCWFIRAVLPSLLVGSAAASWSSLVVAVETSPPMTVPHLRREDHNDTTHPSTLPQAGGRDPTCSLVSRGLYG